MIAVIRVRGRAKISRKIKDTLDMLRLRRKHNCVVLEETPQNIGMVKKVSGYVTWGEVSDDVIGKLIERADLKIKPKEVVKEKPVFRLHPPRKGWGRGGIRSHYPKGALGYRGKEINELILRMI